MIKMKIRKSHKELFTILLEMLALIFSFVNILRFMSFILLLAMTALWIVPDLRFKQIIQGTEKNRDNGGIS